VEGAEETHDSESRATLGVQDRLEAESEIGEVGEREEGRLFGFDDLTIDRGEGGQEAGDEVRLSQLFPVHQDQGRIQEIGVEVSKGIEQVSSSKEDLLAIIRLRHDSFPTAKAGQP
jgi:hypothetical protein